MAWRFSRYLQRGPFIVNYSRSGVGYSFGVPGFRIGINARKKKYISIGFGGMRWYREF